MVVECIISILNVKDVSAGIRYYSRVLGFQVDWGEGDGSEMASVSRDGHAIMLCRGEVQPGVVIRIGLDDIQPLFEQFLAKGAKILEKPANRPWAYEMEIGDLDGNVLRFGSAPKDEPFDGQ